MNNENSYNNSDQVDKQRNWRRRIYSPESLVNYVFAELKKMSKSEYLAIPLYIRTVIGRDRPFQQRVARARLEVILMLCMYMGKSWFVLVHDRDIKNTSRRWDEVFLKKFRFYVDSLKNKEAFDFMNDNGVFIATPTGMIKRLMLSSQVFDSSVYQVASKLESLNRVVKSTESKHTAFAGVGDLIRANEAVYNMFFSIIVNASSVSFVDLLSDFGLGKTDFLALGKLCMSEVPLSQKGLLPNFMSMPQKRYTKVFFNLRTMDYIEEFSGFTESVGGKTDSKGKVLPKYYSATSKGYQVFYKIIQQVTDYGLIYTN